MNIFYHKKQLNKKKIIRDWLGLLII